MELIPMWEEYTFAPASTAFLTSIWHSARLWLMDDVEHNWPIAYRLPVSLFGGSRSSELTAIAMATGNFDLLHNGG
jgi:hypothetical protein